MRPINEVAGELGLSSEDVLPMGRAKAKVDLAALDRPRRGKGRLVLVSAITPTKAGEGKTTVSVGLTMGLRRIGRRAVVCLREPSLGPAFGIKGGGTGGGAAQVVPADDINLHFTGDLHAVTSAHNLLAAMVDNDLHFGSRTGLDPRRVHWHRVLDVNDRALRHIAIGLGGREGGVPRESRFDITAASEVMAVLCLARSLDDLRARLGRMVVGDRKDRSNVTVADIGAVEALVALLRDALHPNLAQTTEGGPALIHGGPFANIAHGCSSVAATLVGMHYADDVVTEAGFGFDLGGEKMLEIKCRQAGLWPRAVVLVATVRALRAHGGAGDGALARGLGHLDRQLANVRAFGLKAVVALNVFPDDTDDALGGIERHCELAGVPVARITAFADGSPGAEQLARLVADAIDASEDAPPEPRFLYDLAEPYDQKARKVARTLYGARDVYVTDLARRQIAAIDKAGHSGLPVCMAKTHLSFTDDPKGGGLASGFDLTLREVRLSAGAGFVVALLGDIMTMPGLPREPAAVRIRVEPDGRIRGLMQGD